MSLIHFLTKSQLTLGRLLIKLILKFIKKKKNFKKLRITKSILEKKTKTLNYSYLLISKLTTNNYNNQDTDLRM